MIIYSVREEIIERALDTCYEKYIEKQRIKFVVYCAHMALQRIINLNFFMHDPGKPYYVGHPDWEPDPTPVPSAPDTWASAPVRIILVLHFKCDIN